MFISANINPLKSHKIILSDDYVATYYMIAKGDTENYDTLIFFVGGSGHVSYNYYLEHYFDGLYGNICIYALQKRYVGHRETGQFLPSEDYDRYNNYPQLVLDQKEFIQSILSKKNYEGKKVILFGVSEGGSIAAKLAHDIPQTTHLMMLGSGGMVGVDEFKLWGKKHNIDFNHIYQDIKKDPDSIEKRVLGQTYKYWSSFLIVNPMDSLEGLKIPILATIGGRDEMTPIESVFFLHNEFERLGKDNLTIKIFPNCDHSLNDQTGKNHREALFQFSSMWWKGM